MKEFKASPKNWNGDNISISAENKNGDGKTILHYFDRSIVLSDIIGCCDPGSIMIEDDRVLWNSSYGRMATDGRKIERLSNIIDGYKKSRGWTMRNFRYIEPGHGKDSLTDHEKGSLDMDFDIQTGGFYALMPVTKYEFGLLVSSSNRDWAREDERLPVGNTVDDTPVEKPYKFSVGDKVVLDPKNKHIPGWHDCGVGEVAEQRRLYRNETAKHVENERENCYDIVWEGRSGYTCVFEDSLMPAPEPKLNPIAKTGTVQFCTSCDEVVYPDPYNPNYLRCGCNLIGQVDYSDRNNVPSWRPASVEIRMKKEEK